MRTITPIAVAVSILLSGCASTPEMKMVPADRDDSVGVRFDRGEAFMVSPGNRGIVALVPTRYNQGTGQLVFAISAFNNYDDAANFGAEDVSIQLDDGSPVAVHDFDRQRHDAKERANTERTVAIISAAAEVWIASRESHRHPNIARSMYRNAVDGLRDDMDGIEIELASALQRMTGLLQTTTIDPGSEWGGLIEADQPTLAPGQVRTVNVTVHFIGENHTFKLLIAPEGTPTPVRDLPPISKHGAIRLETTEHTWLWRNGPDDQATDQSVERSRF